METANRLQTAALDPAPPFPPALGSNNSTDYAIYEEILKDCALLPSTAEQDDCKKTVRRVVPVVVVGVVDVNTHTHTRTPIAILHRTVGRSRRSARRSSRGWRAACRR